ncbi:Rossmann-like and DUF2520 domain-containing protein [Undibacterium sp.]|jgi:predicted short-subunit dehydrogenase-like oxidoreductase (DUF2520 family)|uniref:Rossmann-like and DUF2520 domain-containing protein n=1 Tax=Undibacterium sp. TaxID=1914977 RepID=UPI002CDD11B0|nr:Rossmann-like and DUF2520 domain-containing protein [Undibacterium sp.]HTD05266.1 Rossmann-like and DUF2520 domain-containing protein [Undibacterium sp.]
MKSLSIIGAGKVGRVFGRQLALHGVFDVSQVLNRSLASARQAVGFIGAGVAVADWSALRKTDIYLLSVPDDRIAAICETLWQRKLLDRHSLVFHCSGAKASTELAAATTAGAAVASVHPVRSFADVEAVSAGFAGTICSLEGDTRALAVLTPALEAIQAQVVQISAEAKLLYHAGSVFASNYLVSLMDVALRTYAAAGIPPATAKAMAAPLAQQTLDNVFRLGAEQALTGPIARGDMLTVEQQLQKVADWDETAAGIYRSFIPATVNLAARKKKT